MPGPPAAVAATRVAVRRSLAGLAPGELVLVACSGGPDSLALAAAAAWEVPRLGGRAGAVVVDHALQPGSDRVADHAADQCRGLGLAPTRLLTVQVGVGAGPESAARDARYAALSAAADGERAAYVLLGHTRDDQAEQVLLGLARGSGARSLAGMPRRRDRFVRPLLALPRETTEAACDDLRLTPWHDPHNADRAFLRVRARRVLALMEDELGPGVVAGLSRSADLLRADADTLDALAAEARAGLGDPPWDAEHLARLPDGVRTRVWRSLAAEAGAPAGALFAVHVDQLDALVLRWRGQGPVALPGGLWASRSGGRVRLEATCRVQ